MTITINFVSNRSESSIHVTYPKQYLYIIKRQVMRNYKENHHGIIVLMYH